MLLGQPVEGVNPHDLAPWNKKRYGPVRGPQYRASNYLKTKFNDFSLRKLFDYFFKDVMDTVVQCTNKNVENSTYKSRSGEWIKAPLSHKIDHIELRKVICILLYMPLHQLPNEELYWNDEVIGLCTFPGIGEKMGMSYGQYRQILKYLRFEDYDEVDADLVKDNPAWKIMRITESVRGRVKALWRMEGGDEDLGFEPGEYIAIDEGMLKYLGKRCKFIRIMPDKPIPCGIKFFMMVDYETGILLDYFVVDWGYYSSSRFDSFDWVPMGR